MPACPVRPTVRPPIYGNLVAVNLFDLRGPHKSEAFEGNMQACIDKSKEMSKH